MTDDKKVPVEKSEVEKLRDEFTEQFSTLKSSFEQRDKVQTDRIKELEQHNQELERALVRSAVMGTPPTEQGTPKTEEEIYHEQIDTLANKTIEFMKYL